jgi:hypothetical protein
MFGHCITRILHLLPNLDHLQASFGWNGNRPPLLTTAFQSVSPSRLRILYLSDFAFADAAELESLLMHATGLKELTLLDIKFNNAASSHQAGPPPRGALVHLEYLKLYRISGRDIDAMLSTFSAVDIRRLRFLDVLWSPIVPILKANAHTIQEIRYRVSESVYKLICTVYARCSHLV